MTTRSIRQSGIAAALLVFASSAVGAWTYGAPPTSLRDLRYSKGVAHVRVCEGPERPGIARCHARVVTDAAGRTIENVVKRNLLPAGYGPADLQAAYNIPADAGSPATVIAIVDAYGYINAEADLAIYRATFGLPPCTTANGCFTKYNQSGQQGNYPYQNTGWAQETALDLDMASAACPKCKIILVQARSATYANLAAAVNTAAALGAHVISNSYGGGESGTQSYEAAYNHPGVAITVSTGDSGYGAQFPATSPHVIAAGGTSLRVAGTARGWSETAWNGSGSGCSDVYPKPAWQTDPSCPRRMEADVSAVADPSTGVAVYAPSGSHSASWQVYGGTSVAAPLIGGIYGANGDAVVSGSLYADRSALFDVISGSNGTCGVHYYCHADVGYDGPTGLGTPDGLTAF